MNPTNPTLIQKGLANTPLFLLHDGGGTIFQYFLLGPLGRSVYGIENSRFMSGEKWDGGIPEMAREYTKLIKSVVPSGDILIGGWSLGGLVSLEIAHIISMDKELHIVGIVMIDSAYPHPPSDEVVVSRPYDISYDSHVKQEVRLMVQQSMDQTEDMIKSWKIPKWDDSKAVDDVPGGNKETVKMQAFPPPIVLLRADDFVYSDPSEGVCDIDCYRQTRLLGWEGYTQKYIRAVLPVKGHHYSIFQGENVSSVHNNLKVACNMLDEEC